jgi:hypothetical protein
MFRFRIFIAVFVVAGLLPLAGRGAPADDAQCASSPSDGGCIPAPPGLPEDVPDLDLLKTPPSPALSAVGSVPVDIERPSTPTGAAASLASGIVRGLLVPGTSTALEVTPYWMAQHPLTSADDIERRSWLAFARDFSLSFAAATGPDPTQDPNAAMAASAGLMALGARTTLYPGWRSPQAQQCVKIIDDFMKADVDARLADEQKFSATWQKDNPPPAVVRLERGPNESIDDFQKRMEAANANPTDPDATKKWNARRQAALDAWVAAWAAGHPTAADVQACGPMLEHRIGFLASAAGSVLLSAPGGDFKNFKTTGALGTTVWLTAGWSDSVGGGSGKSSSVWDYSILAASRWRHLAPRGASDASTTALDLGVRAVFAWSRWGLSAQGMRLGKGANGFGTDPATQGALALDYHLKTGYWLTVTAGSNDLGHIDSWSTLTALVHLQYNATPDRMILTDTSTTQAAAPAPAPAQGAAQ